ncbi:glucose sorbosone dehydrogenase [Gloeomargarita lithophora Alchichica-D10]|uniref:Glucose sorbosone dehydrogenase n=1 Tax=Gloeomargarita lithophora Alchichica-D10 TaxID=1188229 RepID=A0A1J0AFA4_9CYAN|nr:PQQ-dependent sugar dehydrogenase [Gloeomargarita lithophora]APB34622.1 glucose sorbosone dehydrogenase [Gloeomargarita lithophora Alchichica-D10]
MKTWAWGLWLVGGLVAGCGMYGLPSQGNAPVVAQETRYRVVPVLDGLVHPWGMAWLPNGELLITERPGRVRRVRSGVLQKEPVSGVPQVLAAGQGGLLDISLHPRFGEMPWVYLTYAEGTGEANRTVVARATWDGQGLTDGRELLRVNPTKSGTQHFGSRLAWLPDETLLVSIGDGGNPPTALAGQFIRLQAQNPRSHLGKVLRITAAGTIPPDNPLGAKASPEIWSWGHRNIQGLAVDTKTGQVWATEHGSRGGDEVNRLQAGQNYGWPLATHSREYFGPEISPHRSLAGMVDPVWVWPETAAPSGLAVYRGDKFPQWQGQLLAGGLISQAVHRFQVNAQGQVTEAGKMTIGGRVRDVRVGPDGLIYVLTDAPNGQLLRIEPAP